MRPELFINPKALEDPRVPTDVGLFMSRGLFVTVEMLMNPRMRMGPRSTPLRNATAPLSDTCSPDAAKWGRRARAPPCGAAVTLGLRRTAATSANGCWRGAAARSAAPPRGS
eukprot:gene6211-biopygen10076